MLRNMKGLSGFRIKASDGEIGFVRDFYFDNHQWSVRYLLAEGSDDLGKREIVIAPAALVRREDESADFQTGLSREKVKNSPAIDLHAPAIRADEAALVRYYGWPEYWNEIPSPAQSYTEKSGGLTTAIAERVKPALYSGGELTGYEVIASDGEAGIVSDFILDSTSWAIRYLVIDIELRPPARLALIEPQWITGVNEDTREIHVNLAQELITNSPEYEPDEPITPGFEREICDHYRLSKNWCGG